MKLGAGWLKYPRPVLRGPLGVIPGATHKKTFWRQYVRSNTIAFLPTTDSLAITFFGQTDLDLNTGAKGWSLDGGLEYPFPDNSTGTGSLGTFNIIGMTDEPSEYSYVWNLAWAQDFMTQLICVKKDGTEHALSDPIYWGQSYDFRDTPPHTWYPYSDVYRVKDYSGANMPPPTIPQSGAVPQTNYLTPPANENQLNNGGNGHSAPTRGGQ